MMVRFVTGLVPCGRVTGGSVTGAEGMDWPDHEENGAERKHDREHA